MLLGAVLLVASSAGCRKQRSASQQAATAQVAPGQAAITGDWDARGKVAAVGADGGLIVQRGPAVEVFAPGGRSLGLLPIGDPEDTPGHGYALSPARGAAGPPPPTCSSTGAPAPRSWAHRRWARRRGGRPGSSRMAGS